MSSDYTYAVARIRSRENFLLTKKDIDMLLSQNDYDGCIRFLTEKGWGSDSTSDNRDILTIEREKIWQLMNELVKEENAFDFFLIPNDFHNLKVSVKSIVCSVDGSSLSSANGTVDYSKIYDAVEKREFTMLPEYLQSAAQESVTTLLQTNDGQLCDIIIDRYCLDTIAQIGRNAQNDIVALYCETYVACANIKTVVRGQLTGKSADFLHRATAPCTTLNIDMLISAANKGFDEICRYLEGTDYRGGVPSLKISVSAFEKWCDDLLITSMQGQKLEPFSIGPLVAYVIARENEIKNVRIILSAKLNSLNEEIISERLRQLYV